MRVIKPTDGVIAAERRLVAAMLCMEHAALAYGPDLVLRPAPHEPWPTVQVRPLTAKGLPIAVHYRPTVGVVFYTAGQAFQVGQLVNRLSQLLDTVPEDHLRAYRAVAATPSSTLRHKGRVSGGNLVVGPRKCYKKAVAEKAGLPARLLLWTPESDTELPPHYSIRAAFTWVFMPVTAALALTGFDSMAAVNAMVASIFYDAGMVSRLADGADFYRLTLDDFDFPRLPAFLAPPAPEAATIVTPVGLGAASGALVVTPPGADGRDGTLAYVGQHLCLRANPQRGHGLPAFMQLAPAPWDPETLLTRGPDQYQCCACEAPIGGDAVVIQGPKAPTTNQHREWYWCSTPPGTPLLRGDGKGLLLCLACWNALESPDCLSRHMGARVSRTTVPFTQAQVCAVCPGYEGLAPLLAGAVRPVQGVVGAYAVTTRADGPGGGVVVVLAGEKLGQFPALTVPDIAALRLPVVASLRLAEVRGAWPRPA